MNAYTYHYTTPTVVKTPAPNALYTSPEGPLADPSEVIDLLLEHPLTVLDGETRRDVAEFIGRSPDLDLTTTALIDSDMRAAELAHIRAGCEALWPDWTSSPAVAAGGPADECTWVDAFGATWGLDSTTPYLIPDAGQYDAAPAAYDRRLACMVGEV